MIDSKVRVSDEDAARITVMWGQACSFGEQGKVEFIKNMIDGVRVRTHPDALPASDEVCRLVLEQLTAACEHHLEWEWFLYFAGGIGNGDEPVAAAIAASHEWDL